jgi:hypothetical protein
VHITVTERGSVRCVEAGLAIARTLRDLHGPTFQFERFGRLLRDRETLALLSGGSRLDDIAASWAKDLAAFEAARREDPPVPAVNTSQFRAVSGPHSAAPRNDLHAT